MTAYARVGVWRAVRFPWSDGQGDQGQVVYGRGPSIRYNREQDQSASDSPEVDRPELGVSQTPWG
jgi:hypothetical protein